MNLIAFFSASDRTRRVAENIATITGGDLFEIEPKELYTEADLDWTNSESRSSLEANDKTIFPELMEDLDISKYDTIYLGFPIWWGIEPNIINSFLKNKDFTGKKIIPFATSGGSGYGNTNNELLKYAHGAEILPGKLIRYNLSIEEIKNILGIN